MSRIILSVVIVLLGVVLALGGLELAALGGSWFYFPLGVALALSGGVLLAGRALGLTLYGLIALLALAWGLWEAGFDLWALMPRAALLALLGLLLLLPPVVRALRCADGRPSGYGRDSLVLVGAVVAAGGVALYAAFQNPHDLQGAFDSARMERDVGADGEVPAGEWPAYGRTAMGLRYLPLEQIRPENVSRLTLAWHFHTGDVRGPDDPSETTYEVTPLVVGGLMYICTPHSLVIALDPVTGEERWRFDPFLERPPRETTQHMTCRGVSYYDGGEDGLAVSDAPLADAKEAARLLNLSRPNRQIMFGMPVYLAFVSKLVPRQGLYERAVTQAGEPVINENFGAPYAVELKPFVSPLGLPCQQPPWGYVAGVDLTTGETVYRHVNGTVRDLSPLPLPFEMGVPGIGGPILTKGGLAFLSGTLDDYVRGYDLRTGEQLWRARLPAGGQATPSTYLGADGRQYLVVVAGGHGSTGTKAGDSVIAYALQDR